MPKYDLTTSSIYYPLNIFLSDHITLIKTSCAHKMIWENSAGIN